MPIPKEYRGRYVYHFTHISNLPGLLKYGFLAQTHAKFSKVKHRSIAAAGIQLRRSNMQVPCKPGGCVHDYVPLYFGSISPMLLSVINSKNVDQMDILYFEFPISLVEREDAVFTDASANTEIPPNFFRDPADLAKLNWEAIDSLKWGSDEKLRHQRMAELLVHRSLSLDEAARCIVWNENAKRRVEKTVAAANGTFPRIEFESHGRYHWFKAFQQKKNSSVVVGPREIARRYQDACSKIAEDRGRHEDSAPFDTFHDLVAGLRKNFGCLPQTAELVGLKSDNSVHNETVDIHTKEVVSNLLALPEYSKLEKKARELVELAAYLHDIGKGPKSRWKSNAGVQKVDPNHPVEAMPMMVDILTRQVGRIGEGSAQTLTKLVCYHDLVGDILGRERDEKQLFEIVEDKEELDMLFALARADATALCESWWNIHHAKALYQRCVAAIEARG